MWAHKRLGKTNHQEKGQSNLDSRMPKESFKYPTISNITMLTKNNVSESDLAQSTSKLVEKTSG